MHRRIPINLVCVSISIDKHYTRMLNACLNRTYYFYTYNQIYMLLLPIYVLVDSEDSEVTSLALLACIARDFDIV